MAELKRKRIKIGYVENNRPVIQWLECSSDKADVLGSIPSGTTNVVSTLVVLPEIKVDKVSVRKDECWITDKYGQE